MTNTRTIVKLSLLTIFAFIAVLPLIFVFLGAFKTQAEFISNPGGLWPESFFNFENFRVLFAEQGFGVYMRNSAIVSLFTVLFNVMFGATAGYALAKLNFPAKGAVFSAVIIGMVAPYTALFAPLFVIIVQMGLVNTYAAMILPIAISPLSVFIMRQAALSVPDEIIESARIDGAGEIGIFARNFLPLVGPSLSTVAILTFLFSWNLFIWPLIVAQSQDKYTLSVGLSVASQQSNTTAFGLLLAGAIIIILPVLILFLLLQKYFIQGVATTGLK